MVEREKTREEKKREEKVFYTTVLPGGYTMTLKMTPEAEKALRATYFNNPGGVTLEKAPQIGTTTEGKPIVQAFFAANILKSMVDNGVSEGVKAFIIGGVSYDVEAKITRTNSQGNVVLASLSGLIKAEVAVRNYAMEKKYREEREGAGFIAVRWEEGKK